MVPIALAVDDAEGSLLDPDLVELHERLDEVGRAHPEVELQYVGPPFDQAPGARGRGGRAPARRGRTSRRSSPAAIERAFDGDLDRFARFMAALQAGVPPATRLVLRGSAVQGVSYRTGEPFDARGPGTSDLDVVLLGEAAMAAWAPDAFYLPGVNTQPLVRRRARHRVARARAGTRGRPGGGRPARGAPGDGPLVPRRPLRAAGHAVRGPRRLTPRPPSAHDHQMRIVSYNIRFGGGPRVAFIGAVLAELEPDVVLLQEATDPGNVDRIARSAGLAHVYRRPGWGVAGMTREPVRSHAWHRPGRARGFLELGPAIGDGDAPVRLLGHHLPAGLSARGERARLRSVE